MSSLLGCSYAQDDKPVAHHAQDDQESSALAEDPISETVDRVIIHHANGLHVSIDDGRPKELEPSFLEILGPCDGLFCVDGIIFQPFETMSNRNTFDPRPHVLRERSELALNVEKTFRIVDGSLNLLSITYDPSIREQTLHVTRGETRDLAIVESFERYAKVLSFVQDRTPRKAGLERLKHEVFKNLSIIVHRHAPFLVVVFEIERIARDGPWATCASDRHGRIVAHGS